MDSRADIIWHDQPYGDGRVVDSVRPRVARVAAQRTSPVASTAVRLDLHCMPGRLILSLLGSPQPGFTALHVATEHLQLGCIRVLVERGADIDAIGGQARRQSNQGSVSLLTPLLPSGVGVIRGRADCKPRCHIGTASFAFSQEEGQTALQLAAEQPGGTEAVRLLLSLGAKLGTVCPRVRSLGAGIHNRSAVPIHLLCCRSRRRARGEGKERSKRAARRVCDCVGVVLA